MIDRHRLLEVERIVRKEVRKAKAEAVRNERRCSRGSCDFLPRRSFIIDVIRSRCRMTVMNEQQRKQAAAALARAIELLNENGRGGQARLADLAGVSRGTMGDFVSRGRIPLEHVGRFARATGYRVKPWEFRPDLCDLLGFDPDLLLSVAAEKDEAA